MAPQGLSHVLAVPRAFTCTVTSIRRNLRSAGLSVSQYLDLPSEILGEPCTDARKSALLMVDCPLLLFEAVALDRSAAVFIPLHVVVTGDGHSTCIHWMHPVEAMGLRLSPTARGPVDALYARLTKVLEGLPDRSGHDEGAE